eukprot:90694_1
MITGPLNGDLSIYCNGHISCYNSIFNAAESSVLNINGCKTYKSCLDLQIYCPPNTNGHKNCNIQGNDNLGKDRPSIIKLPTPQPSIKPTTKPTLITLSPTLIPTISPTYKPTHKPSHSP